MGVVVKGPKRITGLGMYAYCWPGCLTVMYDRNEVGDVQVSDIRKNSDYAMWLKVCRKADSYLSPNVMARYRKRTGSISNHGYVKLIKWHYKLWREVECKKPLFASAITGANLLFGVYKKTMFVERGKDMRYQKSIGRYNLNTFRYGGFLYAV